MTTLGLPPRRGEPHLEPSLPPSPSGEEEDLTKADGIWSDRSQYDELDDAPPPPQWSVLNKGKSKASAHEASDTLDASFFVGEDVPLGRGSTSSPLNPSSPNLDGGAYPPMTDEEAETRRVEENLRRWEVAERQRRKAAREGASSPPPSAHRSSGSSGSSVLGSVARSASLLWRGKSAARGARGSTQYAHAPRHSVEGAVPLSDIDDTQNNSALRSPFSDPPVSQQQQQAAFMDPTTDDDAASLTSTETARAAPPARPVLQASSSSFGPAAPLPPQPFDLPEPRSPPPRPIGSIDLSRPPEPMEPPDPTRSPPPREVQEPQGGKLDGDRAFWWTEVLCGCRPAKSTAHQAGRTNPFE